MQHFSGVPNRGPPFFQVPEEEEEEPEELPQLPEDEEDAFLATGLVMDVVVDLIYIYYGYESIIDDG